MFTIKRMCALLLTLVFCLLGVVADAAAETGDRSTALTPLPNAPVEGVKIYWFPWTAIQPRGYPVLNQRWPIQPFLGDKESTWVISRYVHPTTEERHEFFGPYVTMTVEVPTGGYLLKNPPRGHHVPFPPYLDNEHNGLGAIINDIVIDRDRICRLGEDGELDIVGLWKPEYLKFLVCGREGPEHIYREFVKEHGRDVSFRDDIPRPEYDVQALRLTVADTERYPWGSIGCIRLGNRFFAWKAISDTIHLVDLDPSNAPDNAGTRFMELPALFGIGFSGDDPAANGKDIGWAFMTTNQGIVCWGRDDDKISLISLDGTRKVLAEIPGEPRILHIREGKIGVLKVTHEGQFCLVSFNGKGALSARTKWYPTNQMLLHDAGWGDYPYWTVEGMEEVGGKETYVLEGVALDETKEQILPSFSLRVPKSHYVHSHLGKAGSNYRTPFQREGRELLFGNAREGASFFDMKTGQLVDPAPFRGGLEDWPKPQVDLRELSFNHRLISPLRYKYGENAEDQRRDNALRPTFDLLDTMHLVHRTSHLGTVEDWRQYNRLPSNSVSEWYPIRHTSSGVWFCCSAFSEDKEFGKHLTFVSFKQLSEAR